MHGRVLDPAATRSWPEGPESRHPRPVRAPDARPCLRSLRHAKAAQPCTRRIAVGPALQP
ncbi:hypothetical protein HMPREF9946_02376 [Acetobacteraceae bacterium AT-5844]|nr:hypothetical protein HMPREF9946_02376 [Acetobacteraceae bacterium AT-5844]